MKQNTHPESFPMCFTDVSTGRKFLLRSTQRSQKKEMIGDVEYFVTPCEVTADSHPAYTGEKRFVDAAGRMESFKNKFKRVRG